jgi:hypothetical protein
MSLRKLRLALCVAVVGVLAWVFPAQANAGGVVTYYNTGYQNWGGTYDASQAGFWFYVGTRWSVQNQFASRKAKIRWNNGNETCMDGGGQRPSFEFNWLYIYPENTHCAS